MNLSDSGIFIQQGREEANQGKAISDFEGSSKDKQLFRGHKTESQVTTYERKVKISPTLAAPMLTKTEEK
ncbi:hypothetical protein HMPREF0201_01373 [Cedecea davisae DSM 4568]|uniref:Uncharacterized protein n=1 Tax=Cedecea davisae DSM 4568 TaxID=566551 RepID=S3JEV5_9ENTR|nr:hypothetical protein HMPREF0201_01373 [Cedecea davisae DSM 4568]